MKYRLMTVAVTVFTGALLYAFAFAATAARIHQLFFYRVGMQVGARRGPAPAPNAWEYIFHGYLVLLAVLSVWLVTDAITRSAHKKRPGYCVHCGRKVHRYDRRCEACGTRTAFREDDRTRGNRT